MAVVVVVVAVVAAVVVLVALKQRFHLHAIYSPGKNFDHGSYGKAAFSPF